MADMTDAEAAAAAAFPRELARESWPLYGVGAFFVIMRIYARIHRLGIRGLQADDYIMVTALAWYTTLVICLNAIASGGGSNLFPLEQFPTFSQAEIDERIKGSKIVIISEQAMLCTIYSVKACLLFMYTRLTLGLRQQKLVKALAIYVACGFVGSELAFFFACRPFTGYWAVPPPNPQCTTIQHYSITQACFNISSDLLMLAIMLPLLVQVNLPLRQKIALVGIFSLGSFVIVAAVLTKYFNLSDVYSVQYMFWYTREASTAMYVSNLPMIWPLLREWFPLLRKITPGHRSSSGTNRRTGGNNSSMCGMRSKNTNNNTHGSVQMAQLSKSKGSQYTTGTDTEVERTGSADRINKPAFDNQQHGILTETTVEVDIDEGNRTSDEVDLEKQAHVSSTPNDRMRYDWEQSPSHTRTTTNLSGRDMMVTGGFGGDKNERRRQEVEGQQRQWLRLPENNSTIIMPDEAYVGRAV